MGSLFKGKSIMVKKEGGGSRRMKLPAALSPVSKQIEMCAQLTFFSSVQDPTLRGDPDHSYSEYSYINWPNLYHRHAQRRIF